jgi:hypothetical protein
MADYITHTYHMVSWLAGNVHVWCTSTLYIDYVSNGNIYRVISDWWYCFIGNISIFVYIMWCFMFICVVFHALSPLVSVGDMLILNPLSQLHIKYYAIPSFYLFFNFWKHLLVFDWELNLQHYFFLNILENL